MTAEPAAVPAMSSTELEAIALGNAAVQILGEFGTVEKIGRYWVARSDVDGLALASVIGPPNERSMPQTVNVKIVIGGETVLDVEWSEDHCEVIAFAGGEWQDRLRKLAAAMPGAAGAQA